MTNEEKKLVEDLMKNSISKSEFLKLFQIDIKKDNDYLLSLLEKAYNENNADDIEDILFISFSFSLFSKIFVNILNKLIVEEWHYKHEDIARILQKLKDPKSVEYLYEATLSSYEYLDYDESYALAVKCIWALGDINNEFAIEKLKLLSKSDNTIIKENAINQLNRSH